uniref:Ecdysone-induced protein 74EF-like n=1 Tax=Crassostrea virginica TaxID=6565 RepID=A0A8B8B5H4_CRAVI|nr:ecdysone-induced protein 74EF-like [Crassostrea virginica]
MSQQHLSAPKNQQKNITESGKTVNPHPQQQQQHHQQQQHQQQQHHQQHQQQNHLSAPNNNQKNMHQGKTVRPKD